MDVFFDNQTFYQQKFGGISRYFVELIKSLNRQHLCRARVIAPYYDNIYLSQLKKEHPEYFASLPFFFLFDNKVLKRPDFYRRNFTKLRFHPFAKSILHETYYYSRIEVKSKIVITIHDMIFERYNNGSDFHADTIKHKKNAIERADAIICVSHNTKQDLLNFYPKVADKCFVVHHGVNSSVKTSNTFKAQKPYLLYVGQRYWYKNFKTLLDVYSADNALNGEVDLLCFGGDEFSEEEKATFSNLGLTEKIKYVSGSDELLNEYYSKALAFVYLSEYEGFGMPVLEAMAQGCPVLCSNTSSLPEVAGQAAVLVEPTNKNQISYHLKDLLSNSVLREELKQKGLERVKMFSWDKCARETQAVYSLLST